MLVLLIVVCLLDSGVSFHISVVDVSLKIFRRWAPVIGYVEAKRVFMASADKLLA